jgi:hypothetical protein
MTTGNQPCTATNITCAMQRLTLTVLIFFLASCNSNNDSGHHKSIAQNLPPQTKNASQKAPGFNDSVQFPYSTKTDSGYFRGYVPEKIDSLEPADTSMLFKMLSAIIRKKDIVLLSKETLSHSVSINQKTKTRKDTLKNDAVTITSVYTFSGAGHQIISINGKRIAQRVKSHDGDYINDLALDIDHYSFRHFSFKGKPYFYINAHGMDMQGSSMGNVNHHLLYDIAAGKLSIFITCRFWRILLFGDINGDDQLDFLDFGNDEFCTTVPSSDSVKIHFFSCDKKGNFLLQKDAAGNAYYIAANTGSWYAQDSLNIKRCYWPVPINQ